jgi:hypothetical protein
MAEPDTMATAADATMDRNICILSSLNFWFFAVLVEITVAKLRTAIKAAVS